MTTEDALLPLVMDMLRAVSWPVSAQNPRGVQVLFGAYRGIAGAELVAVTGHTTTTVERNRQESISFDVATLINVPGLTEFETWQRRSEVTEALLGAFFTGTHQQPSIPAEVAALHVNHWRISERVTSVEPASDAIPGASGWVGYSLLTLVVDARPC